MDHIHLIGISGSGISAIARVLLESGYTVSGSDRVLSPLAENLQAAGARVFIGHHPENIQGATLVVRSSAIPDQNPEVIAARAAGIPVLKRSDFLGQLISQDNRLGIAVSGTHGKTTTTAMIAWMLTCLGQDPSFIVGGVLKNLGVNAHAGHGPAFVIEADEYDRMFLGLKPFMIVVTNVDYDHPDCYPTPADYQQAFLAFTGCLQLGGTLLACSDDPGAFRLLQTRLAEGYPAYSYGINRTVGFEVNNKIIETSDFRPDYQAYRLALNPAGGFDFEVGLSSVQGEVAPLAHVSLQVPGEHNVLNALAALAVAHRLGHPLQAAADTLHTYAGAGRRFDILGDAVGITIVDDYAHHPTEIRTTLAAARSRFPGRRLWAVWQPHTFSRTQTFASEFATAFKDADRVVVTSVYGARESAGDSSTANLASTLAQSISGPAARYIPSLTDVTAYLLNQLQSGDVLLVFSAGDADQVSAQVLAALRSRSHG
jgi:UDP-N-acetylmuramate--alanine ligase